MHNKLGTDKIPTTTTGAQSFCSHNSPIRHYPPINSRRRCLAKGFCFKEINLEWNCFVIPKSALAICTNYSAHVPRLTSPGLIDQGGGGGSSTFWRWTSHWLLLLRLLVQRWWWPGPLLFTLWMWHGWRYNGWCYCCCCCSRPTINLASLLLRCRGRLTYLESIPEDDEMETM